MSKKPGLVTIEIGKLKRIAKAFEKRIKELCEEYWGGEQ